MSVLASYVDRRAGVSYAPNRNTLAHDHDGPIDLTNRSTLAGGYDDNCQ